MASDVEKELKEEEKEVKHERVEMQMEAPPRSIRWDKMAKAGLLIIVVGGLFLFLGYKYGKESGNEATETAATETAVTNDDSATTVVSASATTDATADWKTYSDTDNGFSFKYPPELQLDNANEFSTDIEDASFKVLYSSADYDPQGQGKTKNLYVVGYDQTTDNLNDWLVAKYKKPNTELESFTPGQTYTGLIGGKDAILANIGCCGGVDKFYAVNSGSKIFRFGTNFGTQDLSSTDWLAPIIKTIQFTK